MFKKAKRKKIKIFPLAVTQRGNQTVFFCSTNNKKPEIFLYRNVGLKFEKICRLEIVSEKNRKESLAHCENFQFSRFGHYWYLMYSRNYSRFFRKKTQIVSARSADAIHFQIVERSDGKLPDAHVIVPDHAHKNNLLAYVGNGSVHAAASHDLKNWHASGKLLSPRKNHFDDGSLHVAGTLATKRGILVLYEVRRKGREKLKFQIGSALFALDKPYKLLWRSEKATWEKNLTKEQYPLRYLGCITRGDALYTYWVSKRNEIISKIIKTGTIGITSFEKRPSHLKRHHANPIIRPATYNTWEYDATFNPAAIHLENRIHLLYRAIGENGVSVFGYASSRDGFTIDERLDEPAFAAMSFANYKKEDRALFPSRYVSGGSWIGCEDPRLTRIGDRIYMTYVSFDGGNPPGVALTSISVRDFLRKEWTWRRPVLISKPGEIQKNWILFPEKINGKFAILHSITPRVSIEYVDDLEQEGLIIHSHKKPGKDGHRWDNIVRGAGAPPIETKYGWLVLYHAMDSRDPNRYKVGAMILDHDDPSKVLYRASHPILEPVAHYENNGAKPGVVYVCGAVVKEDTLFVYYGGADSVVCLATADIDEFLEDIVKEAATDEIVSEKIIKAKDSSYVRS